MMQVALTLSNQECAALDAVLGELEATLVRRIARELPDDGDHATPAYVALGRLLGPVRRHLLHINHSSQKEEAGS